VDPSLFLRLVLRKYMLIHKACKCLRVNEFLQICVPTNFDYSEKAK
jgi:hypothetical protein